MSSFAPRRCGGINVFAVLRRGWAPRFGLGLRQELRGRDQRLGLGSSAASAKLVEGELGV